MNWWFGFNERMQWTQRERIMIGVHCNLNRCKHRNVVTPELKPGPPSQLLNSSVDRNSTFRRRTQPASPPALYQPAAATGPAPTGLASSGSVNSLSNCGAAKTGERRRDLTLSNAHCAFSDRMNVTLVFKKSVRGATTEETFWQKLLEYPTMPRNLFRSQKEDVSEALKL